MVELSSAEAAIAFPSQSYVAGHAQLSDSACAKVRLHFLQFLRPFKKTPLPYLSFAILLIRI